jgi:hypothetical protein
MTDDPLFSAGSSGVLLALTALQRADGVDAQVALDRAVAVWREHVADSSDSWALSDLRDAVRRLSAG